MSKGARTRAQILDHAAQLASQVGVGGLTIGVLADDLHLSKSGLFGHFRSKQALQLAVLEHAAESFREHVVRPGLQAPRGADRMRALFERWLAWDRDGVMPGGCLFVAAATEFDDQPGPVRDAVEAGLADGHRLLANAVRMAIEAGELRPDTDIDQFVFEFTGLTLANMQSKRLFKDRDANRRALDAFERLVRDYSPQGKE